MKSQQSKLEIARHSFAHLMAAAVLELFPKAKFGIGPAIENGFYYDFDLSKSLSPIDLASIEKEMRKLIKNNLKFEKQELTVLEALKLFKKLNQPFKIELIKDFQKEGSKKVIIYKTGNFIDLCRGPHIASTKELGAENFQLTNLAAAYWKGNEKNPQLQRIYGVAFENKKELIKHFELQKETEKRDHRKIGKKLELFMFSEDIGPGLPIWLPKGMIIREELEKLAKKIEEKAGYLRVWTPHIARSKIYEISGHLPYYQEEMYPPIKTEDGDYYLKPMNCPHHYIIYKSKIRSYKELPIRIAEYGTVYRYEKSGELLGLFRPRGFTQNDAHIVCAKEQIKEEFLKVMKMHVYYYKLFGIKNFYMRLSLADPKNKKKFIGNEKMWQYSEKVLKEAMKESGLNFEIGVGEAAFYGPKIDFQVKNAIGKEYSASTNQLDFAAGPRFGLTFINKKGEEETAFVIHRSPLGSHERFIGFLIEHFAGAFPFWLSPIQVAVLTLNDKRQNIKYAHSITEELQKNNIRVLLDRRNESIAKKIREAELQKIPYLLIVGDKEIKTKTVSVRERGKGDIGSKKIDTFLKTLPKAPN